MKYKLIEKNNYNLHLIETDKFKTISVKVVLKSPIVKEEISLRNMLLDILTESCKKYPVKKELVKAAQNLYATNINCKGYRLGNLNIINFNLYLLDEKYTEPNMFEKSIELLSEIIFKPNVNDNKFDEDSFNYCLRKNKEILKNAKESKNRYSLDRMLEEMGPNEKYSYKDDGYIEDLNKIDRYNLFDYYKKILNTSTIDIYILGNTNKYKVEEIIDKYIKINNSKNNFNNIIISHNQEIKDIKIVKEQDEKNQSNLVIGCKMFNLTKFERNYVINLYNMIFGFGSESKLFKNIREENSLCYHISSYINKFDNLIIIKSGISRENYDKVIELINKNINDMILGNFKEKDIENAKKSYISSLEELEDSDDAIIQTYISSEILDLGTIDERKKIIKEVTKKDIISVAKKIKIDTIYLLEGVKNEGV